MSEPSEPEETLGDKVDAAFDSIMEGDRVAALKELAEKAQAVLADVEDVLDRFREAFAHLIHQIQQLDLREGDDAEDTPG